MKRKLYCAMVTPFNEDDEINYGVLEELISEIQSTHDGVVIAGSTGEGESLEEYELKDLISFYNKFNFEKIISINEDCTNKVLKQIVDLDIPKDYFLLVRVPGYYLPTDDGIIKHFKEIFEMFPEYKFIIYDIEKRTNSKLNKRIIDSLLEYKNFYGIKECRNDYELVKTYSDKLKIFCGDDFNYPNYANCNCAGLISVFSLAYPQQFFEMINIEKFDEELKIEYARRLNQFIVKELNPIGIKRLLTNRGYKSMNLRLPLTY